MADQQRKVARKVASQTHDAGTEAEYKCSTCGNMYPVSQAHCDVCGHRCSEDTCRILRVSNQDY